MFDWLVRIVMAVSGVVTGWFIARDSANFGVVQLTISLLLIVFCILIAVFWPSLVALYKSGGDPGDSNRSE